MEHTFITIHNLAPEANILFVSDSITDILGYRPHEVQGRSCFDYFHPQEVPFARSIHNRGVLLDKAAVLHYARIISRSGDWVSCECCFTVVHDVLVACTSIYRRDQKSERRAIEAPQIRRMFSSSSRDPRYHMLEHLSPKFKMQPPEREPRAAMILNRFTRTLTIMFATNAISAILGVSPGEIQHKSFYECIAPNCLPDAIRCIESAKANDSIAYLRFWFRDPRRDEDFAEQDSNMMQGATSDESSSTSDDSDGGAPVDDPFDIDMGSDSIRQDGLPISGNSSHRRPIPMIELEAVVSCTSDGLVVVLRKARPSIPSLQPPQARMHYQNGLFAAPWGTQPIQPSYPVHTIHEFRAPLIPQYMPLQPHVKAAGGPPMDQLLQSIRDVAVFAWAVVGINSNLSAFSRGIPRGEAQPQHFASTADHSSSSDMQVDGPGSGSWSPESYDDAPLNTWAGPSDVSSMTSQHISTACSHEVSPYVSDDGTAVHGLSRYSHRRLPHPHSHESGPAHRSANIYGGQPRSHWGQHGALASSTDFREDPASMSWQGQPDNNSVFSQPPSDGLPPTHPQSSTQSFQSSRPRQS